MSRVKVTGVNQVIANIAKLSERAEKEVTKSVRDACLDLQGKAQNRAPIDTGDLRGSASTTVETKGNSIVGEVGFNTPYALRQHEELSYNHPQGGEAKYLENPLKENESQYKKDIQDALRRSL